MPLNPSTGAADFMSPGSIGAAQQTDNTPPADYTGTTTADWYRYLWRKGLIGATAHVPTAPLYTAPPPVMVSVPNSTFGVTDGGVTQFPSIESALQKTVQFLVSAELTRNWTDARVSSFLLAVARDSYAWNGDADPGASNAAALVSQYTQVYRVAVTPV